MPRAHKNEKSSMRHIHPRQLQFYRTPNGREPFAEWYDTIQDLNMQNRIDRRLERVANGNFGDCRSIGAGVFAESFSSPFFALVFFHPRPGRCGFLTAPDCEKRRET